jgi:hypothetical protein
MGLAKLTRLRVMRLVFAALTLFFAVSNVRSLASQAFQAPSAGTLVPKGRWGSAAKAAERAAQRAWGRGVPARPLAMARSLVAVVNRSFFDTEGPSAMADWAFDEDGDEGQPESGGGGDAFDAPMPNRAPEVPLLPPLVARWGRAEAPATPLEPFCPPIQRPPIGVLSPCHVTWRGLNVRDAGQN